MIKTHRSELSRRMITEYAAALAVYAAAVVLAALAAWGLCRLTVWQEQDMLYRLLHWIKDHIIQFGGAVILAGWFVISCFFIKKPLGYLDEITAESEKLAFPESGQIRLSPELKSIQDEINLVREKAVKSAAEAKETEQRKNDLIVYLAHDLKTPLTSVIGYLSLMRDEPQISPELRAKYTGIALEKALRLEELINEFFDITRFNLTRISLELERVNFTRMTEQTAFEFRPLLEEKGLRWRLDIAGGVWLLCDPDKLERVLDNLIRNAVNYSYPDREIELSLSEDESSVALVIKNRGRTIPAEKLDRIFEQFFRLDPSRGTGEGGAGLGLAIAKEITELHGGSIKAESENESVTFTVTLPKL